MKSLIKSIFSIIVELSNNIEKTDRIIYKKDYKNNFTGYYNKH